MGRQRCVFRQSDVVRAIRATRAAGLEVARIEIDKGGKIIIIIAGQPDDEAVEVNTLDQWLAKHHARAS
jgi:hypothetical protein